MTRVSTQTGEWTEAYLTDQLLRFASGRGWLSHNVVSSKGVHVHHRQASGKGFPDLVLVRPPRIVFAELKRDKTYMRPEQKLWFHALATCAEETATVEVYCWRPRDWEEILECLK